MAHVLVTGATGFIGGHLIRVLVELGHQVRCLVRKSSRVESLRELRLECVEADLRDSAALERAVHGVECVFHLAALTSAFRRSTLMEVNGQGCAHVARACAAQPQPPVLVVVSSVAAAGPAKRGQVKTEQDLPNPLSNYGRSKRAGELAAGQFAARVPTTIVRPGIVFGAGGREMLPMFRAVHRLRVHAVAGLQSPPLSVIHVSDLVELLVRAAERGQRVVAADHNGVRGTGCYFACRDEYPDYFEFGRLLHQALGNPRTSYLHFPEPFPWLAGGIGELLGRLRGRPFSLNIDKIREAVAPSWACSCAAARRDLGFAPRQTLLEQLRQTAVWYREHGWL
ncbi:MAG: NAD-dependent epimerase/dehydratase family protein [Planctomycetaceae bacterium]|nr:NAD-dependent epimerase/dehydratase family protein [Planctomycetaceae bacterium]